MSTPRALIFHWLNPAVSVLQVLSFMVTGPYCLEPVGHR